MQRREALRVGLGTFLFTLGGVPMALSAERAYALKADLRVLSAAQAATLEAVGETLLPGAREAGIAYFIDHQLSVNSGDCLLFARCVDVAPPYADFYHALITALDTCANALYHKSFAALAAAPRAQLVERMRDGKLADWKGPPSPFVFFVLRNDATDVVYGTVEGFKKLGVPYMPHIEPTQKW